MGARRRAAARHMVTTKLRENFNFFLPRLAAAASRRFCDFATVVASGRIADLWRPQVGKKKWGANSHRYGINTIFTAHRKGKMEKNWNNTQYNKNKPTIFSPHTIKLRDIFDFLYCFRLAAAASRTTRDLRRNSRVRILKKSGKNRGETQGKGIDADYILDVGEGTPGRKGAKLS